MQSRGVSEGAGVLSMSRHTEVTMAVLDGDLWKHNVAKVTVVDVSEDYRHMLEPLPSHFYPVVKEVWLPKYNLSERLLQDDLASGYHYDWHEIPLDSASDIEHWYVGVVNETLHLLLEPASA
jgi:hypothetical protein